MAVPLTGATLDLWAAGVDPSDAGAVLVAAGASRWHLARWPSRDYRRPAFLSWPASKAMGPELARAWATSPSAAWLHTETSPEISFRAGDDEGRPRAALRLALAGNVLPNEVSPRLLACPAVASVVVPVDRPPGALRRRPWQWPMRIGALDDDLLEELRHPGASAGLLPGRLVQVADVRADPAAVGLLVVRQPLAAAVDVVTEHPQLANAVICIGSSAGESWAVTDSRLAMIRAVTGAVVTGIAEPPVGGLAQAVLRTLRYLGHGHTFDVAVTAAFERRILLAGELDALDASSLPEVFRARAAQYRNELRGSEQMTTAKPRVIELEAAAEGRFDQEQDESTTGADRTLDVEEALTEAGKDRVLQAYVARPGAGPRTRRDNVIRAGVNRVEVFVGPEEAGALQGTRLTNKQLGFTADATSVQLTAVLVPIDPPGDPVRTELEVPRVGRSGNAVLPWHVPQGAEAVQARVVLLHRNRVIQTAVLSGRVDGDPATLRERIVLWPDFAHLDERRAFDRAFVMNHSDKGESMLASFASSSHATVRAVSDIESVAGHIRELLIEAAGARANDEAALGSFIARLSVHGRVLHKALLAALGEIGNPKRMQVVSARPTWLLPLEFVYDRPTSRQAKLCRRWLEGESCGPQCFADEDDDTVVCPTVFWGLNRVIERHYVPMDSTIEDTFWLRATPTVKRSEFVATHAALAASRKVKAADVKATAKQLGAGVEAVKGWEEWRAALKGTKTDLLVLMPHSDPKEVTLEVNGKTLAKGEIEKWHVTGGQDGLTPLVILFGCDTSGFKDDPAGYASAFLQEKACAVFSTFTMILGSHAARMSQHLVRELLAPDRKRVPMGEALTKLRSEMARDGLLAGLSVTAYGDTSWAV